MDKIYIVTDLGPGDGGKGGVVQYLSKRLKAKVVIKEGGAQGSHGVETAAGERFNFSQWGCGTLDGVPTYLSERFIISPIGLLNEAEALKRMGIYDPFEMLSLSPDCLVATPFHMAHSQIDELLRKDHPRGTVGTGIGKAFRQAKKDPELAILASDLKNPEKLMKKLYAELEDIRAVLADASMDAVLSEDRDLFLENCRIITCDAEMIMADLVEKFAKVGRLLKLRGLDEVLAGPGIGIVEKSHGVLTDAECGFIPHVSAIRTLPKFTEEMIRNAGYNGETKHLGVHRAYEIRHGAGPMPAHFPTMDNLLADSHKKNNRFQGEVRVGPLDIVLLRYALNCVQDTPMDALCLTWFDMILQEKTWGFVTDYWLENDRQLEDLKTEIFRIKSRGVQWIDADSDRLRSDLKYMQDFVAGTMKEHVDVPVRLVSYGANELATIMF